MFKLFKKMGRKQLIYALICVAFISLNVYLELKIPDYMSEITILVQTEGSSWSAILKEGGYMLLCAFGSLIASFVVGYFAAHVASYFGKITRKSVFEKVGRFSTEEIKKFSTEGYVEIDCVCQCCINEWPQFVYNPQLMMVDYEIVDSQNYYF